MEPEGQSGLVGLLRGKEKVPDIIPFHSIPIHSISIHPTPFQSIPIHVLPNAALPCPKILNKCPKKLLNCSIEMSYIENFDKVEKKIWSQSTKGVQGQPIINQRYHYKQYSRRLWTESVLS